jgi:hypothetical protein
MGATLPRYSFVTVNIRKICGYREKLRPGVRVSEDSLEVGEICTAACVTEAAGPSDGGRRRWLRECPFRR